MMAGVRSSWIEHVTFHNKPFTGALLPNIIILYYYRLATSSIFERYCDGSAAGHPNGADKKYFVPYR
jgi:hypothetical protein